MTATKKIDLQKNKKFLTMDIIFAILMLGALVFAIWKCRYGFGGNDEAFYLTIPHRLNLGDALIKDEWHLSQLSGFLILPFVKLYTLITGGTTGIMLASRFAYIAVHLIVSVVIYIRLRRFGYGAVISSVLFFVYTPYDIMALSYNTMGLDLVALSGVLMATADYTKKASVITAGLCFAGAVLCNPYMAAAYIIFALCVIVHLVLKKLGKTKNIFAGDYFSIRTFLWFTLGAGILAVLFLVFLFIRTSISDIKTNLPYMMADPEHPSLPLSLKLNYYFKTMWECTALFKYSLIAYGVVLVILIADFKRKKHKVIHLALSCAVTVFAYCTMFEKLVDYNYNYIMFPALFLGITSYILCDKKPRELLIFNFFLGIIHSFAMCFSSNQYFYVESMAISASNISSFVFTGILIKEICSADYSDSKIALVSYQSGKENIGKSVNRRQLCSAVALISVAAAVMLQCGMQIWTKANHVFWELPTSYLTTTLSGGPAAGIVTNQANALTYQNILSDISQGYDDKKGENILFLTEKTWTYLAAEDMNYGTFSAWISGENDTSVSRLKQFYSVNPQKEPKYIYIPKESKWNLANLQKDALEQGYNLKETTWGYMLEKR